ncbi:MAG: TolC family protein [Saprospiraceae bacterium]|nr:TolC family protein [Saprospiraceae bacterium]
MKNRPIIALLKVFILIFLFLPTHTFGQENLRSLLQRVERNYPSLQIAKSRAEAVRMNVALEENTYLPAIDIAYQANYATVNNITGMTYPSKFLPISGPPSNGNNLGGIFGSAAGALFTWSPVTFGQRDQKVSYLKNLYEIQLTAVDDELLRLQYSATSVYLDLLVTIESIRAYEQNITRLNSNLANASTLIKSGLRPAVDSIKFEAELSKARSQLYELEHLKQSQLYQLEELLLSDNIAVQLDSQLLLKTPQVPQVLELSENPSRNGQSQCHCQ